MNGHYQREKRLKVSRACYSCRVKKIKCDGIQPCMQCKARNKVCSFFKDDQGKLYTKNTDDDLSIRTVQLSKEQALLKKTSEQLDRLSKLWPGEGKEGHWFIDTSYTVSSNTSPLQAPLDLNTHLLNLFFRYRHTIFPIFSKSIFYRLLEQRDPFISPLLLNSMYCHAAHFSHGDAIHANTYFRKAEELLEKQVDTPSLSVITSLCLLGTFESNHDSPGPHVSLHKTFRYLDMACRMCYDLKLHKRYAFHHAGTTPDEIELRKRVYWVCYCYDKLHFMMTGKPFLLSCTNDIDLPSQVLDSDDDINTCFIEHIKLMQLCEQVSEHMSEQAVFELDEQLCCWQSSLPPSLQWTDTVHPLVSHLHLIYYHVQLTAFTITPSSSHFIQRKRASAASSLTHLVHAMSLQPSCILSFQYAAEILMASVRVHLSDCGDEQLAAARHARTMYQQSLRTLKSLLRHRFLSVEGFTDMLEMAMYDANHESSSSSPIHLSPVIPKQPRQEDMYDFYIPVTRYGLGVYASAHQHHTDVLRQHMPMKTHHTNRPVLLNHFGQVVVTNQDIH